jgi:hypothetical protein
VEKLLMHGVFPVEAVTPKIFSRATHHAYERRDADRLTFVTRFA